MIDIFLSCVDKGIRYPSIYTSYQQISGHSQSQGVKLPTLPHISYIEIEVCYNSTANVPLMIPICDISPMLSLITVNTGLRTERHIKCRPDVKDWMISQDLRSNILNQDAEKCFREATYEHDVMSFANYSHSDSMASYVGHLLRL